MSGRPDLLQAVFHWLEYLGLLGGIGCMVVRRLATLPPRIEWARHPPMRLAFGAAFIGGLGLVAIEGFRAGGLPGWPHLLRVVLEGLAFLFCTRGIPFAVPLAIAAVFALPLAGHAANGPSAVGSVFADAIHVASAGMWAGGIVALASLRPPGGWRSVEAGSMLERFGRIALIAFGVTALTGILRATEQLSSVSDLWSTAYGLVLTFKSAGVLLMVFASMAWRRGLPVARGEAAVAAFVVGATAVLAAFTAGH